MYRFIDLIYIIITIYNIFKAIIRLANVRFISIDRNTEASNRR